jgi:3-methylcrotonyl-CoA carboxylase beta subunit
MELSFLGGPPLVKAATGEVVTPEELGGADVHCRTSGVTDHYAEDDFHAIRNYSLYCEDIKYFYSDKVKSGISFKEPLYPSDEIYGIIQRDTRKAYEVKEIIARLGRWLRVSRI